MQRLVRLSAFVCAFFAPAVVYSQAPPDPLRYLPDHVDLAIKVDQPKRVVDTLFRLELVQGIQQLQAVREYYDSTNFRRFLQMVAHFEKELGVPWPEWIDQLAGDGVAVGFKFKKDRPAVGIVVLGRNEALLAKFVQLGLSVAEAELARQESKDRIERTKHRDVEVIHAGKDFHAAVMGKALLVSNEADALKHLIDHHRDGKTNLATSTSIQDARKLLPKDALAWMWLNMQTVRDAPNAHEIFAHPRNDANLTVAFGGLLDVARRSPFLCAALEQDQDRVVASVCLPKGRDGSPEELAVHMPPKGQGVLPLLEPKGVIFSTSQYLDIAKFWEQRGKLFNETTAKQFEEADAKASPFLGGNKLSKLLTQAGPHQRIVVAYQPETGYAKGPFGFVGKLAYAVVADMRDPALGKSLETILRGAGLLARTLGQVKVKMIAENYGDTTIISYRGEDAASNVTVNNNPLAFLPTPSFAAVGNQFVVASTIEFCKELVDGLRTEAKSPPAVVDGVASRSRLYGEGGARLLDGIQDVLLAQTILDQALSPEEAREEVRRAVELVRGLGHLSIHSEYSDNQFRYEVAIEPKRGAPAKERARRAP